MYEVTYDCSKFKNLRLTNGKVLKSFSIREVNGEDEEASANQAKAKGGAALMQEELLRRSIVKVNGEPVKQPYLEFDLWNARARMFLVSAWRELNGAQDDEIESFLSAAAPNAPAPLNPSEDVLGPA